MELANSNPALKEQAKAFLLGEGRQPASQHGPNFSTRANQNTRKHH